MAEPKTLSVIDIPEHCGNAPRKAVVRDFLIAVYERRDNAVVEMLSDTLHWEIFGSTQLTSKQAVREWLAQQPSLIELKLHTVITHGTECAADGVIIAAAGDRKVFNHVLRFSGHTKTAKIKEIRSYVIEHEDG